MPVTEETNKDLFNKAMIRLTDIKNKHQGQPDETKERRIANNQLEYTKLIFNAVLNPPTNAAEFVSTIRELSNKAPKSNEKATDVIPDAMSYDLVCLLNQLYRSLSSQKDAYHAFFKTYGWIVGSTLTTKFDNAILKQQPKFQTLLGEYQKVHPNAHPSITESLEWVTTNPVIDNTPDSADKPRVVVPARDGEQLSTGPSELNTPSSAPSNQVPASDFLLDIHEAKHEAPEMKASIKTLQDHIKELQDSILKQEAELTEINQNLVKTTEHRVTLRDDLRTKKKFSLIKNLLENEQSNINALQSAIQLLQQKRDDESRQLSSLDKPILNQMLHDVLSKLAALNIKPCGGHLDFKWIEEKFNEDEFCTNRGSYNRLFAFQINNASNKAFNTLGDVFRTQESGFYWTYLYLNTLSATDYKEALTALREFLTAESSNRVKVKDELTQSLNGLNEIIQTMEEIFLVSNQITEQLKKQKKSQENLQKNQDKLQVLQKTSRNHEQIIALNARIDQLDSNDFEQTIEADIEEIKGIIKKPSEDAEYDSEYKNDGISLLKSTEEILERKLYLLHTSRTGEVEKLSSQIERCTDIADCIKIEQTINNLADKIFKNTGNVNNSLALFPDSTSREANQNTQKRLVENISKLQRRAKEKHEWIMKCHETERELAEIEDALTSSPEPQAKNTLNERKLKLLLDEEKGWQRQEATPRGAASIDFAELFSQIDIFDNYATQLMRSDNEKTKKAATVAKTLAQALRGDLNRFQERDNPETKDWDKLKDVFMTRLAIDEPKINEHRSLWKKIVTAIAAIVAIVTSGLSVIVPCKAKQNFDNKVQVSFFATESQIQLAKLRAAATTRFEAERLRSVDISYHPLLPAACP